MVLIFISGLKCYEYGSVLGVFTEYLSVMEKNRVLAEYSLEDGTTVRVAVPEPLDSSAVEEVSILDETLYKADETIESALSKVTPIASAVMSRLKSGLTTPADEVEVTFGLDLSVESGVILSTVGGSVNFQVRLKWQKKTTD